MKRDKEIELETNKLNSLKRQMEKLRQKYFDEYSPKGYKTKTSYTDADTIHAKNREESLFKLFDEVGKIRKAIWLQEDILAALRIEYEVEKTLSTLTTKEQKVLFLFDIMGYTQKYIGEIVGLEVRQVRRLIKGERRWSPKKDSE